MNILSQYTAVNGVEWVWIVFCYAYYIATTCTSTVDHLIDCGNLSGRGGGRVYEALFPKFDGVC
jgi:hypothetical protein